MNQDDTTPRRVDIFPPDDEREASSGPGCLVWAVVGLFGLLLALALVLTAAYAGFNKGLSFAVQTEAAATRADVQRQCDFIPTDIATGNTGLVQLRFDAIMQNGSLPACAMNYSADATRIYLESQATATPTASLTPTMTASPTATATSIASPSASEAPILVAPTNASGYDLNALLNDARAFQAEANFSEVIRTLDAIVALDPSFQSQEVSTLLFRALTQHATMMFRTEEGSLGEAIQLANRARQFGDIGELNYEIAVAQLYLDAQGYIGIDYPLAIRILTQVRTLASDYRDTNRQLFNQYVAYGDALLIGNACQAVAQYEAALQLFQAPDAQSKLTTAQQTCAGAVAPVDPNATPNPQATQGGVAPIGQPGT